MVNNAGSKNLTLILKIPIFFENLKFFSTNYYERCSKSEQWWKRDTYVDSNYDSDQSMPKIWLIKPSCRYNRCRFNRNFSHTYSTQPNIEKLSIRYNPVISTPDMVKVSILSTPVVSQLGFIDWILGII